MKVLAVLALAAMASAQASNVAVATGAAAQASASAEANVVQGQAVDPNAVAAEAEAQQAQQNGVNIDGIDMSNIDLSNGNDLANAIGQLMNNLCLGGAFDLNSILNLGVGNELELFLQMAQLAQLVNLGFLGVGDVASLFNAGNLFGNAALFGGGINNLFGGGIDVFGNGFNLGAFKRAVEEKKKVRFMRSRYEESASPHVCE